jgi:hypothetical protein
VGSLFSVAGRLMAKKTFRMVVFPVFFAVLCWPVQQILIIGLRKCSEDNLGTVNRVLKGGIDADILISGSSRAVYHYDPRIIESRTGKTAFNIGRDGTKPDEQLALLSSYLRHNRKPQYLIQSLDVMNLEANGGVNDPKQLLAWLHEDDLYRNALSHRRYFMIYRHLPMVGFLRTGAMKSAVEGLLGCSNPVSSRLSGYYPQDKCWNDDFEAFQRQHPDGVTWGIEPAGRGALEGILELCRKEGISVILVYSPEYVEAQKITVNRPEIFSVFRDISARYRLPFWDYSQDPISSDRDCFYNSSHLNRKGATLFSQHVAARIAEEFGMDSGGRVDDATVKQPAASSEARSVERGPL